MGLESSSTSSGCTVPSSHPPDVARHPFFDRLGLPRLNWGAEALEEVATTMVGYYLTEHLSGDSPSNMLIPGLLGAALGSRIHIHLARRRER